MEFIAEDDVSSAGRLLNLTLRVLCYCLDCSMPPVYLHGTDLFAAPNVHMSIRKCDNNFHFTNQDGQPR